MTSRTIDIHCHVCSKYMHSELPSSKWNETWVKRHYCKKVKCQEAATFDALTGPPPKALGLSAKEVQDMIDNMMKRSTP